ncbi:MAG: phospho-N-acetylmuramoyl-pentapeptide-transferase [Oscillospiraceae bacterium]|nr:phospho-N-acetylmuramoyl-pentapeptide-transferase [Oscillospiraceae bacterium]
MTRIMITAAAGAVLSGLLGFLLLPVLRALKAGQSIREVGPTWHNYKAGTPMMGGLMFIFALIICLLIAIPTMEDYSVFFVLALALCFGAVGFVDDFCKLKKKQNEGLTSIQKLLLQMTVSAIFLYALYKHGTLVTYLDIPFVAVSFDIHPLLYIFFAMFVMVGCVNAVNLTDGVDGLSSSVTIPVMIFFTAAAVLREKWDLALMPACLVGALIAYLFYNWHPAKVFMGDTGSLFLGGAVCGLAFALNMPLILLLVGFVYIVETLSVILQVIYFKLTHGKRLFKMSPIHHHFEMCGWKETKIVLVFTGVSALMCLIAWFGIS